MGGWGKSGGAGLSSRMSSTHLLLSPRPSRGSAARCMHVNARFAVLSKHYEEDCRTYERVLRYPSGQVRRIRYPVVREEDAADSYVVDPLRSYAEGWDPDRWGDLGWDIVHPSGRVLRTDSSMVPSPPAPPAVERPSKRSELPNSPAELLRHISSEGYRQAARELQARVSTSYEVLEGSPWVQSRPVYVLAMQQPGREAAGLTYTLRTRVARREAEDELSRVLNRRRSDGSALISVSDMRDGIVTFEDEADAARFAALLEADSQAEVMVARADAHELFRAAQSVRSVVVLLRGGSSGHLPQPEQLSAALRSKQSLEDSVDV